MKTRRREMLLFVCYAAILLPMTAGQVLSFGCCGTVRVTQEYHGCCCHSEQEQDGYPCRTEASTDHKGACATPSFAKHHTQCSCVDVALNTSDPQLIEKTNKPKPSLLATATVVYAGSHPMEYRFLHKTEMGLPIDIGKLRSVVLII